MNRTSKKLLWLSAEVHSANECKSHSRSPSAGVVAPRERGFFSKVSPDDAQTTVRLIGAVVSARKKAEREVAAAAKAQTELRA